MAIIYNNAAFPPSEYEEIYSKYLEWGAWYSSDTDILVNIYI